MREQGILPGSSTEWGVLVRERQKKPPPSTGEGCFVRGRGLVLFLLLGGVLGQEFGLDVGGNLDVLGKLHLEGGTTTGEG